MTDCVRRVIGLVFAGLACLAVCSQAAELTGWRTSQAVLQQRLHARSDCLFWYDFGEVPKAFPPGACY